MTKNNRILSFGEIMIEAERVKKEVKSYPFDQPSFQYGAGWAVDVFMEEMERRRQLILSEPDGIVRETMISNLLIDIK